MNILLPIHMQGRDYGMVKYGWKSHYCQFREWRIWKRFEIERLTYPADTDKASTATAIQPPMNDVILKIKPIDFVKQ